MTRKLESMPEVFCIISLILILIVCFPAQAQDHPLSAKEILDKVDDLYRGESSHGKMSMTIVTAHWTRNLELEFWNKGKDKSLIRILAPEKEAGTATLRVGNEIWNYLPKVNRVIKLPSSMMSASWMGSHFTNNDLVKESRFTEDYNFEKSFEGVRGDRKVIEIDCQPKPEAAVVWGKVVVTVRHRDKTDAPSVESYVATERGFAMLRAEESPKYWESPRPAVALQFGMYYVHYAHDCFSLLGYYAKNRPIYVQGWGGGRGGAVNESIKAHPRGYVGGHPWKDTVRGMAGGVVVDNLKAMPIASGEAGLENHRIRKGLHGPVKFVAGRVKPTEVTDTRWVFNEEADEMEVVETTQVRGIYPGVDLERGLFLTDEYMLDAYWLEDDGAAGRARQYDWHVMGAGSHRLDGKLGFKPTSELNGSMLYRDVGAEQPEGARNKTEGSDLTEVRKATTDRTWSSVIVQDCNGDPAESRLGKAWYDRGVGVRVSMLGEKGTRVYAARPPVGGRKGPKTLPETGGAYLMVRRNAEKTTFVALHEPFEGGEAKAPGTKLQRIAQEPGKGLAVRIVNPSPKSRQALNDRIALQLGDDLTSPVTLADDSESLTFRDYAFIRISKGKVRAYGDIRSLKLKVEGKPELTVNDKPADANVSQGVLTYGSN